MDRGDEGPRAKKIRRTAAGQKCGMCHTCQNPRLKQACITVLPLCPAPPCSYVRERHMQLRTNDGATVPRRPVDTLRSATPTTRCSRQAAGGLHSLSE